MSVVRFTYAAAHELFPRRTEQYTDLRIEAVRKVLEQDKFAERSELERELRDPNACVAVAWVEHDVVAACVFRMPPPKKERERAARVMKIIALRVTQGNQNKGFGTAIVKALQHAAAVHGCTKIWVKAAASATSWWQRDKLGFAPCAEAQAAATLWPTDLTQMANACSFRCQIHFVMVPFAHLILRLTSPAEWRFVSQAARMATGVK